MKLKQLLSLFESQKMEFGSIMRSATGEHPGDEEIMGLLQEFNKMFGNVNNSSLVADDGKAGEHAEVSPQKMKKGKELMVVEPDIEEEPVSQFWNDTQVIKLVCETVDRESKAYYSNNQAPTLGEPSYSLGMTQICTPPEMKTPSHAAPEVVEKEDDDNVPLSVIQKRLSKGVIIREKSKRTVCITNKNKSPFVGRAVDINNKESRDEENVWNFLWCISGDGG